MVGHHPSRCRIHTAGEGEIRWIEGQGRPESARADTPSPARLQGIVADITARRLSEETLRQAQKMEVVGQLTGGIAHDFNNLLTVISGSLELLETDADLTVFHEARHYISVAQGASNRAAGLTHRLLAFARRQTLAPGPTNLQKLVEEMEDLIRQTIGPEVEVDVRPPVDRWLALVDPNQLENALLNLCVNARDAMPHGGKLTIATGNLTLDASNERDGSMAPGQYVTLSVTDTGTGMSADVIAHAFEPFFTTKPTGLGTGLGLSMVYGFASQSGGYVRIESQQQLGTTVIIYLPRHREEEHRRQAQVAGVTDLLGETGQSILIVDDMVEVRMVIGRALARLGYATIEASDGAAGLKVLQHSSRVDLLITDMAMPGGMNGRQLAHAARLLRPELQVLFITGYAESLAVTAGQPDPNMHMLAKPFSLKALATAVRALVSAG
jgi:signal transduction histidine kinase/CheY-like chemotaxis protein